MNRSVLRGVVLIGLAVVIIAGLILMLGAKPKQKTIHPPNKDPWVLVSYDPNNPYGTYLGNGFISTRVMADGVGKECYMAGLYDDEKLIQTPNWAELYFYEGDRWSKNAPRFELDKQSSYVQVLDMKTGILFTKATWRSGKKTLTGTIEVIVSRAMPSLGLVKVRLTPNFDGSVYVAVPPELTHDKNLYGYDVTATEMGDVFTLKSLDHVIVSGGVAAIDGKSIPSTTTLRIGASYFRSAAVKAVSKSPFTAASWHWIALDKSDNSVGNVENAAKFLSRLLGVTSTTGFYEARAETSDVKAATNRLVAAHKAAMAKLWQKDIIIDGPVQDQQAVHSCMFYLMQSVREGSQWSIPPMGLSNNAFSGHVFWDADLWMFPALILQHPELAKSIVDYRYNTLSGAMANAKADGFAGAQFAWESGFTGKEDTPAGLVYRHERHINGDIAIAQWQYFLATNDLIWLKTRGYPVLKATADWWVSKAIFVKEKNRYEILQVVPPDENAELVNNSAYTNAIAQMNLKIASRAAKLTGSGANPKWAEVANKLYIPYDAANKRFIAHDTYKGYVAKQADNELLAYPLQVVIPGVDMNEVYKSNFDFYSAKVHKNGPAMTSSAYSVIAARLGDRDRAYSEFVKSYKPFLRGPFNLFNEKPSKTVDNLCFLTGAAGPIQSIMFGLAGARMDYFPEDLAKADLQFKPCLPKAWKSLKLTGVQWRGKTFDVTIDSTNKATIQPK